MSKGARSGMCCTHEKCNNSLTVRNWCIVFTHTAHMLQHKKRGKFEYDPTKSDPDLTPQSTKHMARTCLCRTHEKCNNSLTVRNWAVVFTHTTTMLPNKNRRKFEYDPTKYDPDLTPQSTKHMARTCMCRTHEKCNNSLTFRNWAVVFTHTTDMLPQNN